jgi:hypothetical protein
MSIEGRHTAAALYDSAGSSSCRSIGLGPWRQQTLLRPPEAVQEGNGIV